MMVLLMSVLTAWLVVGLAVGMVIGGAADFGNRPAAYGRISPQLPPNDR